MITVLVVAAHPDDEVLGCGGTIARHAKAGDNVRILFMTDGESARAGATADMRGHRAKSAIAAAKILGADLLPSADFPDNRMDSVPLIDIVNAVEGAVTNVRPSIVYTHHGGDLNVDHRIAHQAVLTACRPQVGCPVTAIYAFEVLSSTEWASSTIGAAFQPNRFVDIGEYLETKLAAIESYASEMRAPPHSRSRETVRHLAHFRGATNGLHAAEAFMVIREIL